MSGEEKKNTKHKTKNPSGNQEAAGTLRSCPKEGCGCTRQTVAAGFPGTRVAPGKSVFLSLYFSSLPPSLSQHPRSRSRAFVPSFRLASFRLVVLGGPNPLARGGAGAPSPMCRRGRRRSEKSRGFFGEGGGSLSPRSALRISLPPSGTWKRYGLRKSLRHGWGWGA